MARPSEVSATIGCRAPYSAGPDQLGHPGVDDDLRPAAVAHVEHARHQPAGPGHERPPGLDRQAARSPVVGDAVEQLGQLAREAFGTGRRLVEGQDREPATDVERVERGQPAAQQRDDREPAPDRVAPGIDGPELRPDVQMDAARPDRTAAIVREPLDQAGRLGLGQPELGGAVADVEARDRLGRHVRVEPDEDVERRPPAPPEAGPAGHPGDRLGFVRGLERDPRQRHAADRGRPDRRPQVRVGLADPFERDPAVGHARLACDRPLAARDDVRPEAARRDRGDDARARRWP